MRGDAGRLRPLEHHDASVRAPAELQRRAHGRSSVTAPCSGLEACAHQRVALVPRRGRDRFHAEFRDRDLPDGHAAARLDRHDAPIRRAAPHVLAHLHHARDLRGTRVASDAAGRAAGRRAGPAHREARGEGAALRPQPRAPHLRLEALALEGDPDGVPAPRRRARSAQWRSVRCSDAEGSAVGARTFRRHSTCSTPSASERRPPPCTPGTTASSPAAFASAPAQAPKKHASGQRESSPRAGRGRRR